MEVRRDDLAAARVVDEPPSEPADRQALLAVERFGLTANVITYGRVGDAIGYWRFFPARDDGWGRLPAWGFAEVVASATGALAEGERVFGYVPMASHLVLTPEERHGTIVDTSAHRAGLPGVYNTYRRAGDAAPADARELILRPLFMLGFLLADQLREERFAGAEQVLVSSASSKTALGIARELDGAGARLVGLTSARHAAFVEGTGVYDEVVAYDALETLDPATATVSVDLAGDLVLRRRVHEHYGERLRRSVLVGATHGNGGAFAPGPDLAGPEPVFFFAPERLRVRGRDWGRAELGARVEAALARFSAWTEGWLRLEPADGPDALLAAYGAVLRGEDPPDAARVATLAGSATP